MDKNALVAIITEAKQAAAAAAQAYVDNWTAETGGNRYGEPMCCGFAWCNFKQYAGKNIDGRTKIGRLLREAGLVQAWPGYFQWWNPAGWGGQSEQVKVAGAWAAARVLEQHGFTIGTGSKTD